MPGAFIKEEENRAVVEATLSASRDLRSKCRHEPIFKDVAINESLGLILGVHFF
jgi:hypothetical protein